jgi:SAM-dependent methyltransferase
LSTEAMVSASDIARLAGVGRAAVSNWRRRYEDFPQPVGGSTNHPLFDLASVERWLSDQGKLHRGSPWDRLWQLVEAYRDGAESADMLAWIGRFLLYLDNDQHSWTRLRTLPDEPLRDALPSAIDAAANHADLSDRTFSVDPARIHVLREVAQLAEQDGAATAFGELLDRFVPATARWMNATTPDLARLMADLAGVRAGVVLDPACGIGTVLAEASGPAVRCLGQEIDPSLARIAAIRLALLGRDATIRVGDSLLGNAFTGQLADAVVCVPPFNERHWGHEELLNDPRWVYGIPARLESELAWLQHAVAQVKPGGTIVLSMPPSAASRRSGRRIRAELLRSGALRAVVALAGPTGPTHLWLLRRPVTGTESGTRLLVVDASESEWAATELVIDAWRAFEKTGVVEERPGRVRTVPVLDVLTDEIDLTPARNLPVSAVSSPQELQSRQRDLAKRLAELARSVPTPDWGPPADTRIISTIAELVQAGAVSVQPSTPVGEPPRHGPDGVAFLEVDDLLDGRGTTSRVSPEFADTCARGRAGDVAVPMVGGRMMARVLDGDVALARGLCLLRPNPQVLDPWFLAGFLTSSRNSRQASTHLSAASRLDVRRCEIPRLPIAEQQQYGAIFQRLADFTTTMAALTDLAGNVVQEATDGLANGGITPPSNAG